MYKEHHSSSRQYSKWYCASPFIRIAYTPLPMLWLSYKDKHSQMFCRMVFIKFWNCTIRLKDSNSFGLMVNDAGFPFAIQDRPNLEDPSWVSSKMSSFLHQNVEQPFPPVQPKGKITKHQYTKNTKLDCYIHIINKRVNFKYQI